MEFVERQNGKPLRDFFFLFAFPGVYFWIARDHLGAAPAKPGDFEDTFHRGGLMRGLKFAK